MPDIRLADAFQTPEAKRRFNRRIFTTIAPRYDLITRVLSYGQDRRWKARALAAVHIAAGERVLDLAAGTGDFALAAAARGARVTAVDLTMGMLEKGRSRDAARRVGWVAGDMTALPCRDETADVVTSGYGLRNVPHLEAAIAEIWRVLRHGGRFVSLDFERPAPAWKRRAYLGYLWTAGGALGWLLHRDADTYRYIAASLARYPGAAAVSALLEARGFRRVEHQPLLGGLMALHVGVK
ncbi:MAG: ubiquinone/menaquinone biosynthesis methyltransferase [Vicinamibacteraceae bacterium]|nr:ubiquinone/menaquinone biosynthesis methyltransferase [Vicinamibacteraceae bacterium]